MLISAWIETKLMSGYCFSFSANNGISFLQGKQPTQKKLRTLGLASIRDYANNALETSLPTICGAVWPISKAVTPKDVRHKARTKNQRDMLYSTYPLNIELVCGQGLIGLLDYQTPRSLAHKQQTTSQRHFLGSHCIRVCSLPALAP